MKVRVSFTPEGSRYAFEGMTAGELAVMRGNLVKAAAADMLEHYQWPSPYTKRIRNSSFAVLAQMGLLEGEHSDFMARAISEFKRLVRVDRCGGHFRGGKYQQAIYAKRI